MAARKKRVLTPEEQLEAALVPEAEWPYKVPANWCWVKLASVVDLYNGDRGVNYPSKKDYVREGIPFINAGAIQNGRLDTSVFNYISRDKFDALRAGKVKTNDILYCLRGSLGKSVIIPSQNGHRSKPSVHRSMCRHPLRTPAPLTG